ncbi:MAG: cation-translocating P-type ATPase [Hespellia sp.]|nr:cation-translocating P-type ATPase [Hespellia sp.]
MISLKKRTDNNIEETFTRKERVERFQVDPKLGLTDAQVSQRFDEGYSNAPVDPPSKSVKDIIHDNVFTYFNAIFVVLGILLIIVGSFKNLTFLPVIIANTLIGIIQEVRAKKTLDELNVLHAPKVTVIRSGVQITLPADEMVLDDVIYFTPGSQIPADAIVLAGEIQVNESLITGESDEITKKRGDALLSGSFIVSGKCLALADKVGADSYISKLTLEAKTVKEVAASEMMQSLTRLVKWIGIIIIPIGLILVGEQFLVEHATFKSSIISMEAAVVGMIPEGLYLLASVALAVSVLRLAKKDVLVHEMACIETLARVDVLCVDKTGTITENTMEIDGLIPLAEYKEDKMAPLDLMIGDFADNMGSDNITMNALKKFFVKNSGLKADHITGFSSATKYSSATFGSTTFVLGAPEFVLRKQFGKVQAVIEKYSSQGFRVLVFGKYHGTVEIGKPLTGPVEAYALILMSNPIRQEAPTTFQYFEEEGVSIKVISGDNPVTVSEVAKKACITGAENYIDASKLNSMKEIEDAMLHYTVFGRVTPKQKQLFVEALKKQGHTVAMTGDGVNDVLALKDADCSIAMASGSDAAAQASQIVLLDSNFGRMPEVVLEGRRVVNNIQRSSSLFLVKNIFSLLMAIFSMISLNSYPLTPSQVSMVSMFTIGIPAFFLALEPNTNRIQGHFLTNVLLKALPAGLTNFVVIGSMVIFGNVFEVNATDVSTASALLLAIVGLMILYRISKPLNLLRLTVFISMIAGLIVSIFYLSDLFSITAVSLKCGMLLVVFSVITEPLFRYLTLLIDLIRHFYEYLSDKFKSKPRRAYKISR